MISQNNLETIKKIVQEFFEKMCFEVEIEVKKPLDLTIPVKIKTEEPRVLIGEGGQTLIDIQRLLKVILKRKILPSTGSSAEAHSKPSGQAEQFYIDLDINTYKEKKITYLKEMARSIADEVALSKKERILAPMPAYERRIIHLELAERGDIASESVGWEPERSVVIRPYP